MSGLKYFWQKITVPSTITCVVGYFSERLVNILEKEGKGKYNGNSWCKKYIHTVNVLE